MGLASISGLITFVALFTFHAYRTVYVYTMLPRAVLLGDFIVSAVTGVIVALMVSAILRDAAWPPPEDQNGLREALARDIADVLLEGGSVSPSAFARQLLREGGPLASLIAERDAAVADMKAAEAQNDALHFKLAALAPHGSCACSYDQPGDVCAHHSPALRAAEAEITRLKEGIEALGAALKPFCFGDPTLENILFGSMPDDATCNLTVKLRDTRRARSALATPSPKEQP